VSQENKGRNRQENQKLPIAKNQDVEFSMDLADEEDLKALERAEAADKRQDDI
jgi:hypothetical protein